MLRTAGKFVLLVAVLLCLQSPAAADTVAPSGTSGQELDTVGPHAWWYLMPSSPSRNPDSELLTNQDPEPGIQKEVWGPAEQKPGALWLWAQLNRRREPKRLDDPKGIPGGDQSTSQVTAVPEPASLLLLGLGFIVLALAGKAHASR